MQRRHALIVERHLAANEDIQDDAEGPDVDLGTGVRLCIQELGRGKVERAAEGREVRGWRIEVREAEVDDLDVAGLGDEDVLNLQVCGKKKAGF